MELYSTELDNFNYRLKVFIYTILLLKFTTFVTCTDDRPPLDFSKEPVSGSPFAEGTTKILICQVYSVPAPKFRWMKDGQYITDSSVFSTLKIENTRKSHAGEYRCQAENYLGSILSNAANVQIAYLNPIPASSNETVAVSTGSATVINLPQISSYPSPIVYWLVNNNLLANEGPRHQISLSKDLVLLDIETLQNNNKYTFKALNSFSGQETTNNTKFYTLSVTDTGDTSPIAPSIIVPPQDTVVHKGSIQVNLECIVNARPISSLNISWYKITGNQRTLINQSSKYILSQAYFRQLIIKDPIKNDSGVYECEATLAQVNGLTFSPVSAQANLTVYESPEITSQIDQDYVRDFSQNLSIDCKGKGIPQPTIHWYFNSQEIKTLSQSKYTVSPDGTLSIVSLELTEAGMYQCFARNVAGETKKTTWIKVNSSPPEIREKPENLTIVAGSDAQFPCKAVGAPKPVIIWSRITSTGATEITSGGRYQILEKEELLLITTTEAADSGHYGCNATNSRGSQAADAFLEVLVRTVITRPPQNLTIIKGSSAVLQCGVSHDPKVQVQWYWYHYSSSNNPQEVTAGARHTISSNGNLTITGVYNVDIGKYKCQVVSAGGNDSREATLQVIELPGKPIINQVMLSENDLRSANVTWNLGFTGYSPIQRFILQYRKVNSFDTSGVIDAEDWIVYEGQVPPTSRFYIVGNLRPARHFQFKISAVNIVGEGKTSDPKPFPPILMPEQAPSSPPRGFFGSPRSNSSIMLQWQAPPEDSWNGDLIGYMIQFKLADYPDSTYQSINTTNRTTQYELRNLIIFQEYELQIAAYNRKGVGVFSNMIQIWTMEGKPTSQPRDVNGEAVNSTAIKVTWIPVDPAYLNGINLGYEIVAICRDGCNQNEIITVPPRQDDPIGIHQVYLHDLRKFTNYSITVSCYTSVGNGPESPSIVVQTEEDVPGQVNSLSFQDVMDTSLKVIWTAPDEINGILLNYILMWQKKDQVNTRLHVSLNPSATTYTIRNLTPSTKYTILLYATTAKGNGTIRSADIQSGVPPERPKPPHKLGIYDVQARSVQLQFLPGYDGKTSITTWIVEGLVGSSTIWEEIYRISDPDANSIVVQNLRPYTQYMLRIIAVNIVGPSLPSNASRQFQTKQDSPNVPPDKVTVRAINSTALRVSWAPLSISDWNGPALGYRIFYRKENGSLWTSVDLNLDSDFFILRKLEEWMVYEVKMQSFNDVGSSSFSSVQKERTRDSTPSHGPENVQCIADSSTSINCTWGSVPYLDRNGIILGYKVHYTDMSTPGNEPMVEDVSGNTTKFANLKNLRKFVEYKIQVLAYTRMGDGKLSAPQNFTKTHEDVPGPPVNLWFPAVTDTTAKIMWSPPVEPNGIITRYIVSYKVKDGAMVYNSSELTSSQLELSVLSLQNKTFYIFSVTARTRLGWGAPAYVTVYTTINRRKPDSPTKPQITSEVQARSVTIIWQPGFDGYGPLRNYTIQYKEEGGTWTDIKDTPPADVVSFTITGLCPNTRYNFRVAATNDIGTSPFSNKSDEVLTLQDKPEGAPQNLKAVPLTTKSISVSWEQPPPSTWNGDLLGYIIQFRQQGMPSYQETSVPDSQHSTTLSNLQQFTEYEIRVSAFNSIGEGPHSFPISIYVGDAAPSAPPQNVQAITKNATALVIRWEPPPLETQNGKLSGYKVACWLTGFQETVAQFVVAEKEVVINSLENFSNYSVVVLAYNTAGDGPPSPTKFSQTSEWLPGKPGDPDFYNVTMTSLNVSWSPPAKPNGIIRDYDLTYLSNADGRLVKLSNITTHFCWIDKLEENVTYIFTVVARTSVGPGPEARQMVRTGPQKGSPDPPQKPSVEILKGNIHLSWVNGNMGVSPITGYDIYARTIGEWMKVLKKNSPEPEARMLWPSQCTAGGCWFYVVAYNYKSISYPSPPSELVRKEDVAVAKPFHYEWWFQVIVALGGLVVILIIISLLCLMARKGNKGLVKSTSNSISTNLEPFEPENGGFTSVEMRQSRRSLARIGNGTMRSIHSRNPPRPSPASVTYSEDIEGAKGSLPNGYDDDDDRSSSVTEKPSELGDSTEPSDDESDITEKPLPPPPPSASPPPPPFRTQYINDPVRQSWQNHSNYNAYNYTDSEADSSHYALSLNSGHVIMNNAAGSRAPLPGFSSFV